MAKILRVGIIGASASPRWASISHVPAVQALSGLDLAAVVTTDQKSAGAAAKAFGVKTAYGSVKDLFKDSNIDLVAVAVRVPAHRELVLGAIAAGKHGCCEWPLGRDGDLYLEDAANGATLLTIHSGHALDTAVAAVGQLASVAALTSIQYPEIEVGPEARRQRRSIPDNLTALARFAAGGVLSVEVAGARPADTTFRLEVDGDVGRLVIEGAAPRGFQSGRSTLALNGQSQALEDGESAGLPDAAVNVASLYSPLRDDIVSGDRTVPNFDDEVRLTRLITDVARAAETSVRHDADGWPAYAMNHKKDAVSLK